MVKTSPSTVGGTGWIPSLGAKLPHASWCRTTNGAGIVEQPMQKNSNNNNQQSYTKINSKKWILDLNGKPKKIKKQNEIGSICEGYPYDSTFTPIFRT